MNHNRAAVLKHGWKMSIKTTGKVLVENDFRNLQESADFLRSISLCPSLDSYEAKSLLLLWDDLSSSQYLAAFESLAVKGFFAHGLTAKFVLGSWRTSKNTLLCVCWNFLPLIYWNIFFLQIFESETSLRKDNLHPP